MKRRLQAKRLEGQFKKLLKKNPRIKEALRVFDISYDQYQKSLEGGYSYHTTTSTSPAQYEVGVNKND